MDSLGDYLMAFCGFGVVCCGGGALLLFVLMRFTGLGMMFPAMNMFSGMLFGEKENAEENVSPEHRPKRKGLSRFQSFRARAQAAKADFEPGAKGKRGESRSARMAARDFSESDPDPYDSPGLRSNRNRPRRDLRRSGHDSAEDEVFGGMFDEDGDGFPDV